MVQNIERAEHVQPKKSCHMRFSISFVSIALSGALLIYIAKVGTHNRQSSETWVNSSVKTLVNVAISTQDVSINVLWCLNGICTRLINIVSCDIYFMNNRGLWYSFTNTWSRSLLYKIRKFCCTWFPDLILINQGFSVSCLPHTNNNSPATKQLKV